MKRIAVLLSVFVLLAVAVGPVSADRGGQKKPGRPPAFDPSRHLAERSCGPGQLVVNVRQRIVDDVAEGTAGNVWARTSYERHIQIRRVITDPLVTSNVYCALVKEMGRFVTIEGDSPAGDDEVLGGIRGTFMGGSRTIITGTLEVEPIWRTRGNLGVFDFGCDGTTTCPGADPDWQEVYFGGDDESKEVWFSWRYNAGRRGTYIKSSAGSSGDIN